MLISGNLLVTTVLAFLSLFLSGKNGGGNEIIDAATSPLSVRWGRLLPLRVYQEGVLGNFLSAVPADEPARRL